MGRQAVFEMESIRLPPLEKVIEFYESAANIMHPCRVIGVAVNGRSSTTTPWQPSATAWAGSSVCPPAT